METWTQTQLFMFASLWSSAAAVGVLHTKSKAWPSLTDLIGTILLHGCVGGSLGFFSYDIKGFEKSVARIAVVSAGYGAGIINAKAWLVSHGFISKGKDGAKDV